eukprot:1180332-Prorocentrum_minimum.AAC.1
MRRYLYLKSLTWTGRRCGQGCRAVRRREAEAAEVAGEKGVQVVGRVLRRPLDGYCLRGGAPYGAHVCKVYPPRRN